MAKMKTEFFLENCNGVETSASIRINDAKSDKVALIIKTEESESPLDKLFMPKKQMELLARNILTSFGKYPGKNKKKKQ